MRKFLIFAIPIVTIALFICIMLSGSMLKKSFGNDDDVSQCMDNIRKTINKEEWEEANREVEYLDKAWNKVIVRVQFSAERDEINDITTSIARLRGAIEAEDKVNALMEVNTAYSHWIDIGN